MKNIVLILGNGFDLSLGYKTSYKDFYESEFCPKDYPAPMIKHLNSSLGEDLASVKWYDFENELLNYYKAIERKGLVEDIVSLKERNLITGLHPDRIYSELRSIDEDISNGLYQKRIIVDKIGDFGLKSPSMPHHEDLLHSAEWRDRKAFQLINDGLKKYLSQLSCPKDTMSIHIANIVMNAIMSSRDKGANVNVYSFNYTRLPSRFNSNLNGCLHYVHGSLDADSIIIGTQDYDGISEEYDYIQKSFDGKYAPPALVYDLHSADEVVVFGHSLGVNDRQYFKSFFKKQSSADNTSPERKKITIFTRDERSVIETKRSLQQMSDNNLASLYGMNDLKIIRTESLEDDQDILNEFLQRYISDVHRVEDLLGKLLDS